MMARPYRRLGCACPVLIIRPLFQKKHAFLVTDFARVNERINRRSFVKKAAVAGAGLSLAPHLQTVFGKNAPSETVRVGVMGVNSRGMALTQAFARTKGAEVAVICDVDERALQNAIAAVSQGQEGSAPLQEREPEGTKDVRRVLDNPDVDALVIAAPDHWHAPATMMALDAGKHVYVEKPCSHNPEEGEMLVQAQQKHSDLVVQMGNQQRSAPESIEAVQKIRDGLVGRPYYARAWYANDRGPTTLKSGAAVPDWLDYELWQGPAPRRDYQGNLIHYNWHWFWNWGTGEILNNGTHEIDVCRWALGVDYPVRVTSAGGRYAYDDDWEAFDTQVASYDFDGEKSIAWEGRSCNANPIKGGEGMPGGGRGASIHGTEGTVLIDRSGYVAFDNDNNEIERNVRGEQSDGTNVVGAGDLTDLHAANFTQAVREGATLNSPIEDARKSVLMCHLGNIAQRTGHTLTIDPATGRIENDEEAMQLWSREYAQGWKPKV